MFLPARRSSRTITRRDRPRPGHYGAYIETRQRCTTTSRHLPTRSKQQRAPRRLPGKYMRSCTSPTRSRSYRAAAGIARLTRWIGLIQQPGRNGGRLLFLEAVRASFAQARAQQLAFVHLDLTQFWTPRPHELGLSPRSTAAEVARDRHSDALLCCAKQHAVPEREREKISFCSPVNVAEGRNRYGRDNSSMCRACCTQQGLTA